MAIDEELRHWYQGSDASAKPNLWPRIAARMEAYSARRTHRRPIGVRIGFAAAVVLGLCGAALYFSPRLLVTAYAMMQGSSVSQSGLESVLLNDPALNSLWHRGSIVPMSLSETRDHVRITIIGVWTDSSRTVVLYRVKPQFLTKTRLASPWGIVEDNSLALGLAQLAKNHGDPGMVTIGKTSLHQYPITLSDQFGVTRRVNTQTASASGYGYVQFPPFTALERAAGLRLTLRIGAVQAVSAPNGPLGKKNIETRVGNWAFHFSYIPTSTKSFHMTPDASATFGNNTITLTSVATTASETLLEVDADRPFASPINFLVQTPMGRNVFAMNASMSGRRARIALPPLKASGTYTLLLESMSGRGKDQPQTDRTRSRLSWTQPAWDGTTNQFLASNAAAPPLYHGDNWNLAVSKLGYSVVPPAKGYIPTSITVTDTWQSALSGRTDGPVPTLSADVQTPSGIGIGVTQGRTYPTFLPSFESLAQFRASLAQSSGSTVLKTVDVDRGIKGYLLSFNNHSLGQGVTRLHWLTVVLPWGNITFGTTQAGNPVPPGELVKAARAWLAGYQIGNPSK